MRFLCLHGMGTSGRIFQAQMSQIAGSFAGQHEFVYIDGGVETEPMAGKHSCVFLRQSPRLTLQGVETFFSGPFHCFYELPTPEEVNDAYDLIWDAIEEDGPFDGIVGFSQGGALASSFVMADARAERPQRPFKCGVFFCASMPFDNLSPAFTVDPIHGTCYYAGTGKLIEGFDVTESIPETASAGWSGTYDDKTKFLHRYTSPFANIEKAKMDMPTVHVVGAIDDYRQQGIALRDLCSPLNRQFIEHGMGHDIPKDRNTTTKIVHAMQQMFSAVLIG